MALKVSWDDEAEKNLEEITNFILDNWNENILAGFLKDLNQAIEQIKKYPLSFPASQIKEGIRKCVINEKISLYYSIKKSEIEIRTLLDNRQDNEKTKF